MKRRFTLCLALCALPLIAGSYALGQATAPPKPPAEPSRLTEPQMLWIVKTALAEEKAKHFALTEDKENDKENAGGVVDLTVQYQQAARNPALNQAALHYIANDYINARAGAKINEQVTRMSGETSVRLQMLQVAQNERIIELLDKLNAKK